MAQISPSFRWSRDGEIQKLAPSTIFLEYIYIYSIYIYVHTYIYIHIYIYIYQNMVLGKFYRPHNELRVNGGW